MIDRATPGAGFLTAAVVGGGLAVGGLVVLALGRARGGSLPRSSRTAPHRGTCRRVRSGPSTRCRADPTRPGQTTEPVNFSPGPSPGASGNGEASRNASWSERSPSRSERACWLPMSGAEAVTSAASAVMSLRASSRSRKSAPAPVGPVLREPALDRRGAHQVDGGGRDDLDGGDVRDVAGGGRGGVGARAGLAHAPILSPAGDGAPAPIRVFGSSSGNLGSRLTWVVLCRSRERPGARGPGAQVEFLPPGPRPFGALDAHRRQRPGSQSAPDGASRSRWREHGSRPCAPRGPRGLLL